MQCTPGLGCSDFLFGRGGGGGIGAPSLDPPIPQKDSRDGTPQTNAGTSPVSMKGGGRAYLLHDAQGQERGGGCVT